LQQIVWFVSLFFMAVLVIVFAVVFFRSKSRADYGPIQQKAYRLRRYVFMGVLAILVSAAFLTLRHLPYDQPAFASGELVKIQVSASQFVWDMSQTEVKVGQLVEFDVTSQDVNHGFGIYDEQMQVVAQTQAMPGYTNKLYYTFTKPGTYKILCLEYCGAAHHYMAADFEVKPDSK